MAHEISTKARWGASYKVNSADWTPDAFAGKRLLDAALTPADPQGVVERDTRSVSRRSRWLARKRLESRPARGTPSAC